MNLHVHLTRSGTLNQMLPRHLRDKIVTLKITGKLNDDDFDVLDDMCEAFGMYDDDDDYIIDLEMSPALRYLDLSDAIYEKGGGMPYIGFHSQVETLLLPKGIDSTLSRGEDNTGFSESSMLRKLGLPEGLKDIGGFSDCPNLSDLSLPESTETIRCFAFCDCKSIRKLYIPRNVREIYGSSFSGCGIAAFEIDENNPYFTAVDGVLYSKDLSKLVAFPSAYKGSRYDIPFSTKHIGFGAFMDSGIVEVSIPESVETIADFAFQNTNLNRIFIPDSVKSIGDLAFRYCNQLKSIRLSHSITHIPNQMVSSISSLKKIVIPGNVKTIEYTALAWCHSLKEIILEDGVEEISGEDLIDIRTSDLQKIVIPKSLKKIPGGAFNYSRHLEIFEIDSDNEHFTSREGILYSKDNRVLISSGHRFHKKIIVPEGVEIIEEMAFIGMSDLETIELPNTLKDIRYRVLQNCENLRRLDIPPSVERIDMDALWAENLKDIYTNTSCPPLMYGDVKDDDWRYVNVCVHVPVESEDAYRCAPGWKSFQIIADRR